MEFIIYEILRNANTINEIAKIIDRNILTIHAIACIIYSKLPLLREFER